MKYFSEIQQIICMGEGILPITLQQKTKKREIVFCRQLIMYFMDKYTRPKDRKWQRGDESWALIAGKFGKDHATAMYSVKAINNLIDTDKQVAYRISVYQTRIEEVLNFKINLITDKFVEIKEILKVRIENGLPITYDNIIVYNKLLESSIKIISP
jgi:hypothetical protein